MALDDDERDELERLRSEVTDLRARAGDGAGDGPSPPGPDRGGGPGVRRLRWAVAALLVFLAAVIAPVTLVARYARNQVLDTDEYVATVAPLADDPALQAAVTDILTTRLMARLDVEDLASDALDALTERGVPDAVTALAVPIADQVEGFVHDQVGSFLATQTFADLWEQANRAAHTQVDALLTGEGDGVVSSEEGIVTVDLGEVVARVQQRLVDRGFSLASDIPDVDATVTLVESESLSTAQTAVRWLDRAATALPLVLLLVVGLAVAVAPGRRRALVASVVAITLGILIVGLAVAGLRTWYLDNGHTRLPPDAAESVIRTLLAPLRDAFRASVLLGLVIILLLLLTGPSPLAHRIRAAGGRAAAGVGRLASGIRGLEAPSGLEAWVAANKALLQLGGVGVGIVVLALWSYPGLGVILAVLLVVGGWAALVEFVARGGEARPVTHQG